MVCFLGWCKSWRAEVDDAAVRDGFVDIAIQAGVLEYCADDWWIAWFLAFLLEIQNLAKMS